jgi:4-amino-4-deoxy-L-arabinose transferase-like glycosyltransferase
MRSALQTLISVFVLAIITRWLYAATLYATMGENGLMSGDSFGYLNNAQAMAAQALAGTLHGWDWLGPDVAVLPLYPWLLMLNVIAFGPFATVATVFLQGVIDAGTCLLVSRIAGSIDARLAMPAAVAAALNPTMIVLSAFIYNDTVFVFFVTLVCYGAVRWMQEPSWHWALLIGIALALAALDRILIGPFIPVLIALLLGRQLFGAGVRMAHLRQLATVVAIFCLSVAPVLVRNVSLYGAWSLTPQGGSHLALWIGPLVREAKDGTPWTQGSAEAQARTTARFGDMTSNPFVNSRHYVEIGREELAELGLAAIIKTWAIGAAINLASPALIIAPPIANLPRTGFYQTEGKTVFDKIYNFLFHFDNAIYGWFLLIGIAGVALFRIVQAIGFLGLVRDANTWPTLILMALWIGFILAANGPIASPKYRLPIEPVLCVVTAAGVRLLRPLRYDASRPSV